MADGNEFVRRTLGVEPEKGGEHQRMGTHNALLRLGEETYLEVTIPADGSLPLQGIAPVLIQWLGETHPAAKLQDFGCSLIRLEGFHADAERIDRMLKSIGFEGEFRVSPLPRHMQPYLVAHIQTPTGERQLRTS